MGGVACDKKNEKKIHPDRESLEETPKQSSQASKLMHFQAGGGVEAYVFDDS